MSASSDLTLTATVRFQQTTDYAHVLVDFVEVDAEGNSYASDDCYRDLQVYSQLYRHHDLNSGGFPFYAWELIYKSPYAVGLSRAQGMVKLLSTVERKLRAAEERDGRVTTLGQYIHRICRALGVTKITVLDPRYSSADQGYVVSYRDLAATIDSRCYQKANSWQEHPWVFAY